MKRILICAALVAPVIAGCVTTSEVTEIGKDTYMVGTEVRGGQTKSKAMTISVKAATEYCAAKGKKMMLTHTESSGYAGWTPVDSEIQFMCLSENDPQYRATVLRKDPTSVVEIAK